MTEPASSTRPTEPSFETASWGRRVLALLVDWAASTLAVIAVVGWESYGEVGSRAQQLYVPLVFVVESAVLTYLVGGSFGKLVTRLRVVPADGRLRPHNPLRVLARQVLILLVIPPLVFRPDGRGLHDLFARTATVTLQTYQGLLGRR